MFLTKRYNGYYYLNLKDEYGRIRRVSCKTKIKADALQFWKVFNVNQQKGKFEKKSLNALMMEYLTYCKSIHTKKTNRGNQLAFTEFIRIIGNIPIDKVQVREIESFLAIKREEASVWTARKYYITLAAAFEKAKIWEYIPANPFRKVKKPKPPECLPLYFSKEEFSKFLNAIDDMDMKELMLFGLFSGMRLSEITNLRWCDVDLDRKIILIQNSEIFRTKSGRSRNVPMNDELYKILFLKNKEAIGEFVFSRNGKPYRDEYVSKTFKKHVRRAGLNDRLHFHSLRHTFASWLVQQGTSLYEVQKLLGHQDIKTSMIYAHLQPETLHNTVNKLTII